MLYDVALLLNDPRLGPRQRLWLATFGHQLSLPPVMIDDNSIVVRELERLLWYDGKFKALALHTIASRALEDGERRMELRGVRPQESFDQFLLESELLEARWKHWRRRPKQTVKLDLPSEYLDYATRRARFQEWVEETKLPYEKFAASERRVPLLRMVLRDLWSRCVLNFRAIRRRD